MTILTDVRPITESRAIVYWRDGERRVALPVPRKRWEAALAAAKADHAIAAACLQERFGVWMALSPNRSYAEVGRRYGFSRQRAFMLIARASAVVVRALNSKE